MKTQAKWTYHFSEGRANMKDLLGSKGANLCEIEQLGIPTPPGFIIVTTACKSFHDNQETVLSEIWEQILASLEQLQIDADLTLGSPENPLLVSVRSGAPVSMPGMMDTIINVGLTDKVLESFKKTLGDDAAHRILIGLDNAFARKGIKIPLNSPVQQLRTAIEMVFNSWNNERAIQWRRERNLPDSMGTAVIVQKMVFGIGQKSGTGVLFTRDPVLGQDFPTGEWVPDAFGEELVIGSTARTKPFTELMYDISQAAYQDLLGYARKLGAHFKNVQDIEYTVDNGKPWILQCRKAILGPYAAARIAHDLVVVQGDLTRQDAIKKIDVGQLDNIRNFAAFDKEAVKNGTLLGVGLNPSFGVAIGLVALSETKALQMLDRGQPVILVTKEADNENLFRIMKQVNGILTQRGGATSHAALVARAQGKACVVGCGSMELDPSTPHLTFGDVVVNEGDPISIDAWTGNIYLGKLPIVTMRDEDSRVVDTIERWAQEFSAPSVWASADYRFDPRPAKELSEKIRNLWYKSPFQSDKARSARIRSVIPDEHNIVMRPVSAMDYQLVKECLLDSVRSRFWAGVRTGLSPQPLGKSPWVMGIKTEADVENFLQKEYQEWLSMEEKIEYVNEVGENIGQEAKLTELIIVSNPPYLGLRDHDHEHFVFRMSCQNGTIALEANLGTAQLRSIERDADRSDLIRIECPLDFREREEAFQPRWKIAFGTNYLQTTFIKRLQESLKQGNASPLKARMQGDATAEDYVANRLLSRFPGINPDDDGVLRTRCTDLMEIEVLPEDILQLMATPQSFNVTQGICKHVFQYWWNPEVLDLPYMMWAFDLALDLHVLEAQGRMTETGEIEYIRVYDVRGREEKQEAERAQKTSHQLKY